MTTRIERISAVHQSIRQGLNSLVAGFKLIEFGIAELEKEKIDVSDLAIVLDELQETQSRGHDVNNLLDLSRE